MKSEATLQFEIYRQLQDAEVPCELEWTSPAGRLDIAVKDERRLYGVIECKKGKPRENTFQLTRYRSMGVPVIVVNWETDCSRIADKCREWICGGGATLEDIAKNPFVIRKWRKPRGKLQRIRLLADEDLNIKWD
jgi:hypothetical protein